MCDFYSEIGRQIGQLPETYHDKTNSHSGMIETCKWRDNQPNGKTIVFEFECKTDELLSDSDLHAKASSLIRNFGECPEALVRKFISNAIKVREALKTGKGLTPDGFFSDTKKFCDVWNKAIERNIAVILPAVFAGDLYINSSAKLEALTKVGGYLSINPSAKLEAPALAEVGGYLSINSSAKLEAPKLKSVNGRTHKK